jgi:hypothetical protein
VGGRRSGVAGFGTLIAHRSTGRRVSGVAASGGASSPPVPGYFMWLAADAITGQADNTALASWPDGGSGNNAMGQATGALQPTYYKSTAGKTVNGKPAVWFSNANASNMRTTSNAISLPLPVNLYIVAGTSDTAAQYDLFSTNGWSVGQLTTHYFMQAGNSITGGTPNTTVHNLSYYFAAVTSTALVDGIATISGSAGGNGGAFSVWAGSNYGGTTNWNGPICEVILYTSTLSGANDTATRAYLKTKWGTAG